MTAIIFNRVILPSILPLSLIHLEMQINFISWAEISWIRCTKPLLAYSIPFSTFALYLRLFSHMRV